MRSLKGDRNAAACQRLGDDLSRAPRCEAGIVSDDDALAVAQSFGFVLGDDATARETR
jgi:hypothetical protein